MKPSPDAPTYKEIEVVISTFYDKLINHPELGHFFEQLDNFDQHLRRITDFWWMAMGGSLEQPPKIDMIGKHFPLGIRQADLQTWLALFSETLEQTLADNKARYWMDKVLTIAARLKQIVIDHQAGGVQIRD